MKNNRTFLEKLLDGAEVEWKPLGNVAKLTRGRVMSKEYLSENRGSYSVYSSQTANNGEIGYRSVLIISVRSRCQAIKNKQSPFFLLD